MSAEKSSKVEKKPSYDFNKQFKILQEEFSKLGVLGNKLKGVKDSGMKKNIRDEHLFNTNKIKNGLSKFKAAIREAKNDEHLKTLLTWERQRKLISAPDEYELNALELAEMTDSPECECYAPPPVGLRCEMGARYKYKKYFDEARDKDVYITYNPVTISPEEQITKELAWKMSQGFMPEAKDYLPEKTLIRRFTLVEDQWRRHFREV